MQSFKKVDEQLKRLNFNYHSWGKGEAKELCNILRSDEVIEECVNGYYEAGFAMLLSTKDRVLLVDKKPFNYLTVEDMRFDMINELDYSHRLFGAQIKISAGAKTLHFTSWNQVRLRRVMTYVQNRMSQIKSDAMEHQDSQRQHLETMNKQLEMYLKLQQVQQQQAAQAPQQQPRFVGAGEQQESLEQLATAEIFGQGAQAAAQPRPDTQPSAAVAPPVTAPAEQPQQPPQSHLHKLANLTPQEIGVAAAKRVVPVISAYTRLPLLSQNRRNTPQSSVNYTTAQAQ